MGQLIYDCKKPKLMRIELVNGIWQSSYIKKDIPEGL